MLVRVPSDDVESDLSGLVLVRPALPAARGKQKRAAPVLALLLAALIGFGILFAVGQSIFTE